MDRTATLNDAPHLVDRLVGARIRTRRRELGVTQERLATALGVSFQQVQKYERGDNRVSASKLWEIARELDVSTSYFFQDVGRDQGLDGALDTGAEVSDYAEFLCSPEGEELARVFPGLHKAHQRTVLELVRAIVASR